MEPSTQPTAEPVEVDTGSVVAITVVAVLLVLRLRQI
jgi:hypothetical protein